MSKTSSSYFPPTIFNCTQGPYGASSSYRTTLIALRQYHKSLLDKPCERPCDKDLDQENFSPTKCIKDYIAGRVPCYARAPEECTTEEEARKVSEASEELSEIEVREGP